MTGGMDGAYRAGMHRSLTSLLFVTLVGGCTATGSARYSAEVTTPNLVYVSDDVQVIEDYNEPVFFSANMYWRYDNGVWFQSRQHTRGWVRVSTPPAPILRIERPAAYVHFHAHANAGAHQDAPPPPVREERHDMKEERHEMKQEAKEERKDERKDAKEERKEERKDAKDDRNKGKNRK
ncbi:hypothetical protein BH11MYX3_BH11MYX3_27740 [soil metagenome]